jgi:hypothetical protein
VSKTTHSISLSNLSESTQYHFYIEVTNASGTATSSDYTFTTTATTTEDIYIAQSSAGDNSGSSCANAHSVVWFNTSGNWANPKTAGKIGPGDTVHLCGTITSIITVQESGLSGSPIIIYFENGAKLSQPASNLMSTGGKDYLVIDGGTNGIIEATDNGTEFGNQLAIYGITASNSENLEIKNLTFQNLYVHTSVNDNSDWGIRPTAIYFNGTGNNISIHDNVFDDVTSAIILGGPISGASNVDIYGNDFFNYDHGVTISGADTSVSIDGYSDVDIYNNHFGSTANWDSTENLFHHDGIHIFHPMNYVLTGLNVYNNLFDGDWGANNTAQIYMEGEYGGTDNPGSGINDTTIFNNIFKNTNSKIITGILGLTV